MENTPQYIKQVPWYVKDSEGKGQEIQTPKFESKIQMNEWYQRGLRGPQANKFRKGACENCGAVGHNKKQCTERPRKVGAKYTNEKIAADDVIQKVTFNWESKRDRWNGFEPEMYKEIIEEHEQFEEIRKKQKLNEGQDQDDKQFRKEDNPLQLANLPAKHQKNKKHLGLGGVRNREDRAKYLNTLDLNGPTFDPKSRAMKGEQTLNNPENIGQKAELEEQINFTSEQHKKHQAQLSSVALPTLTEKIYKTVKQNPHLINPANKNISSEVLKKYGATESDPQRIVFEETDQAFEHNTTLHHQMQSTRKVVKSRYQENVMVNDHTSVWGSWYSKTLGWGYACCYGLEKNGYCLGANGKEKSLALELKKKAEKLRQEGKIDQDSKLSSKQQQDQEN